MVVTGDSAAFTEIYDRYAGVLYLHICRKLGNRETAKDLIHDSKVHLTTKNFSTAEEWLRAVIESYPITLFSLTPPLRRAAK